MDMQKFSEQLRPLVTLCRMLPLDDPVAARAILERDAAPAGKTVQAVRTTALEGARAGWLLPKEAGGVRFGRVAKDLDGFSVDAVWSAGAGPRHRHPRGEIDLLFAVEGEPRFDGNAPGWAVYAPGSEHVPGVLGGTMLILYFLPGGAIDWL